MTACRMQRNHEVLFAVSPLRDQLDLMSEFSKMPGPTQGRDPVAMQGTCFGGGDDDYFDDAHL